MIEWRKITEPNNLKKILIPIYILLLVVATYHIYFAKRIIPGVTVGSVNVGGMTYAQAKRALVEREVALDKKIILGYGDQEFEFDSSLFDLEYNIDATVIRAFEVGRTGNFYVDSKEKVAGFVKPLRIGVFYDIDDGELGSVFFTVKGELNEPPQNAYYKLEDGKVVVVPSSGGTAVDGEGLYNLVISSLENLDFTKKEVVVEQAYPEVSEAQLQAYVNEVSRIIRNPLKIVFESSTWELGQEQMLGFISVEVEDDKPELVLNKAAFEAYAELFKQDVDQLPRGKVTEMRDNRVVSFEITQEGRELDVKQFTEDFKDAFFGIQPEVELAVAKVTTVAPEDYGIYALLGEGTSKYTGSAAERAHNLNLAADRASGVLVAPGDVFSFNASVGDISSATGYASAFIISNGRTVLGDGGGVCQTSTTLFRAVLNAGLPVVSRNPHAYRVYYYEIDSDVGFDASIYQPSLDFQFKNDTPNYVLVQSFADKPNQILGFRLYGTPDGRQVEISEVTVTNVKAPPKTLYQDDPSLPKGTVKQVDFSAWGATASFNRIVKDKNGEMLFEENFTTNYQPWRAIYLVGTKEI